MLDHVLVVVLSEFGRTPRINGHLGRDHWPEAWSAAMAGAGIVPGQVVGETVADGSEIKGNSYDIGHLFHTIFHALGISTSAIHYEQSGQPLPLAHEGMYPIKAMLRKQVTSLRERGGRRSDLRPDQRNVPLKNGRGQEPVLLQLRKTHRHLDNTIKLPHKLGLLAGRFTGPERFLRREPDDFDPGPAVFQPDLIEEVEMEQSGHIQVRLELPDGTVLRAEGMLPAFCRGLVGILANELDVCSGEKLPGQVRGRTAHEQLQAMSVVLQSAKDRNA
jgi:hypothetical protein